METIDYTLYFNDLINELNLIQGSIEKININLAFVLGVLLAVIFWSVYKHVLWECFHCYVGVINWVVIRRYGIYGSISEKDISMRGDFMLNKVKKSLIAIIPAVSYCTVALADGVADQSVVNGFTTLKDDIVATLGAVAPLGIGIMAIFLTWRYGKRLFKTVAR